jgi:hypothetical protein
MTPTPSVAVQRTGAALGALLSVALVAAAYLLFGDVDINPSDEGFLWYGVIHTAAGEVPLRDFQSYEPGRYYWGAAWSLALGEGILALRLSNAIFQALGLFFGLLVARRLVDHPAWLVPIGILLILWMFPRYKVFESSLSMMAVYAGLRLLETRSRRALFGAGVFVGLAAFFGRNHGLYAGLGVLLITLWLHWKQRQGRLSHQLAVLAGGVFVGASPLLGMILFVPGFGESFIESVRFFIEHGANLPKPIPWPWQADYANLDWSRRIARFTVGAAFVLAPLVYGVGLVAMLRSGNERLQQRSVLIAATAVGIFYLHHASVRSDAEHLAECIHPLLLAGLAIPGAFGLLRGRLAALATLTVVALLSASVASIYNEAFLLPWQAKARKLVTRRIAGDELRLPPDRARYIARIDRVVRQRVPENETLLIAPYMPTLYPMLGKSSPIWDLYLLWEADADRQDEIIRSLEQKRVAWALIAEVALDGRQELRFRNSHRRVWEHLAREFELVRAPGLPAWHTLMRRRSALDVP